MLLDLVGLLTEEEAAAETTGGFRHLGQDSGTTKLRRKGLLRYRVTITGDGDVQAPPAITQVAVSGTATVAVSGATRAAVGLNAVGTVHESIKLTAALSASHHGGVLAPVSTHRVVLDDDFILLFLL